MEISVIIPNYNGEYLLQKNMPKVIDIFSDYKDGDVEIILVDDGSTDNSLDIIQNYLSTLSLRPKGNLKLTLIRNEKNLGFSSTVNRGVKDAKGEIVILLNTDVVPEKDFLLPLLKSFADPNVFAIGCMDKSIEGSETVLRGRGIGKWQRGFLVHSRGKVDKKNTLWVSGGSGVFRKSIWNKLGGFNILYNPFYWEDIDLSYRALKSGFKILFEPKSIVIHEHEEGSIKKQYSPPKIRTIAYRNQFIFVWENATDLDLRLFHLLWLPYHFLKALRRGDISFFLGFIQAFIFFPRIMISSFKAQRLFVKSDKEVMKNFLE